MTFRKKAVEQLLYHSPKIVFVGTSHIVAGVDPDRFNAKVVNLAENGLNYQTAELLILKYWDQVKSANSVVIELDSVPLCTNTIAVRQGDFRDFWDWGLSSCDLPLGWWEQKASGLTECFAPFRFTSLWDFWMFNEQKLGVSDKIGPGFHGIDATLDLETRGHFFAALNASYDEEVILLNLYALNRILDMFERAGVSVSFVRPPMHPEYWQEASTLVRENIVDRAMEQISVKLNGRDHALLNYALWDKLQTQDFRDFTHLSLRGSAKWSDDLSVKLIEKQLGK